MFSKKLRPETLKNDSKIKKKLKIFRKRPNSSNCFRMRPNASQWVRMDPNGSEHVRQPRKTREIFEKTCKNFEKLHENFRKNFFHGVVFMRIGSNCLVEFSISRHSSPIQSSFTYLLRGECSPSLSLIQKFEIKENSLTSRGGRQEKNKQKHKEKAESNQSVVRE